ncbi:conserved hypothetical protein [Aeropyrum pernix]|uniref:DUF460 domain-containing protein n=2 Tax=Aeropyrum pernix TaxID=56636 RepID=A0A401H8B4_AERPX|nr:conserved hypothetical protein [Aeropyrum pernix]
MGGGVVTRVVMGVDIVSGEPGSRSARYAVVILGESGRLLEKHESVSLARLIRVAWSRQPDILAVDNVFELGRSERDVGRVASMLPPKTRLVQVTLEGGRLASLREVAERYGIRMEKKLTPTATAYLLAVLALEGAGTPVSVLEEKTLVTVSRARSGSSGGWSQARYQRRVRAAISQAVSRIRESLDRAGLDYDLNYRRSEGGIESATFIVYAPREKLEGVVRRREGPDYTVRIKPVARSRILTLPDAPERSSPIIVGIDPGITTGLAVLDINGRLLHAESGKSLDRSRVTEIVYGLGRPVIVAVDVADPPETAKKLAAQWGAMLYTPPADLTTSEKWGLARRVLGSSVEDTHVRDAAAAAYKAYLALESKLRYVERAIEKMGIDVDVERVKIDVIRGATLAEALERAIEEELGDGEPEVPRAEQGARQHQEEGAGDGGSVYKEMSALREMLEALRIENSSLKRRLEEMEAEVMMLKAQLERARARAKSDHGIRREAEMMRERVRKLERRLEESAMMVEELKGELEELRRAVELLGRGTHLLAVEVDRLTLKTVREAVAAMRGGRLILVLRGGDTFTWDAVEELAKAGVEAVVADHPSSPAANALKSRRVPVIPIREVQVLRLGGYVLVSSEVLRLAEEMRAEWRRRREASVDIIRIVEEYRRSSRRG